MNSDLNISPVRNSESFHTSVHGENVSHMAIVEPEPRGTHLKTRKFGGHIQHHANFFCCFVAAIIFICKMLFIVILYYSSVII